MVPATLARGPSFEIRSPSAIGHVLRAPGRLGLGRAYVEGSLDADDLDEALAVVDTWTPPPLGIGDRLRLLACATVAASTRSSRRPPLELVLRGQRHTPERDALAVRYHYDVGNDFFALFLDSSMTYSCALFSRGAGTLEEAQQAKLKLVAEKLKLRPAPARSGRGLRVGELRDPCRAVAWRVPVPRRHALRGAGRARQRAGG